jgi:two-component system nitrate/nitrite sensor histidine kinase NarX
MISVPVRLQQRLIGAINLFFHAAVSLNSDEIEMLDTLASHLASAWESWRVAALEREAVVAEERSLIARELHDSIAQSLSFLKIQVQLLRAGVQKNQLTQVQTALDELDAGLRESVSDVRELLLYFRTRTNSLNIEQALQETLRKFEHQTHLPTHFQVHGKGLPLPPDVQVQVLHIIQEALSNVRKHAQATQVHLDVFKGESWRFQVRDDGVGFDADDTPGEMHVGLRIMRERALCIGAQVTITAQQPKGATVTLNLSPYPVATPEAPLAKERQDLPT